MRSECRQEPPRHSTRRAFFRSGRRQRGSFVRWNTVSRIENATELHGLALSPGFAEAEVTVMRDPREFSRMKPGTILVAPATDPSWTPLFTLASRVIVEVGGILSHASTVARGYGLPALANVKLDAINGVVEILG